MNSLFRLSIFVRCALEVRRCLLLLGLLFVVGHESGKALERVILLPVHVGVNFTIEADRYLLFGKALRDARSAAVRVIYGHSWSTQVQNGTFIKLPPYLIDPLTFVLKIYRVI